MNYPKVLNVHIYPTENSRTNPILTKYCLVLVIVHTGYTLHGGHYYVYAREIKRASVSKTNANEQEDYFSNDEWFLLNDDHVTLSSYEAMIENCAQYSSATPYVLFYKRIDEQRIEEIERTKQIHIHESLIEQIQEDNLIYEHEQGK
jgi:ubiquitin C-terminal hydrolase